MLKEKKSTKRKLFNLTSLLFMFMVLFIPNVVAKADSSKKCGKNVTWSIDESGTLTISGTGDMWDSASVPEWDKSAVKKVVIEDGVTSIGNGIYDEVKHIYTGYFCKCDNLTEVDIASSVRRIGDYAFLECSSLKTIDIPAGIQEIGMSAFSHCGFDSEVIIPEGVVTIDKNAFSSCHNLKSVVMSDTVVEIKDYAFNQCSVLSDVELSKNLKKIGYSVFLQTAIQSITIPETVTEIGCSVFMECKNLKSITLPTNMKISEIGDMTFMFCENLTAINIPYTVENIGENAFLGTKINKITLPPNIKSVDNGAFATNTDNITVTASETVVYDTDAFKASGNWYYSGIGSVSYDYKPTPEYDIYSFSVCFDANGGSGIMTFVPLKSKTYDLPECTFTAPEGKIFVGWDAGKPGEIITVDSHKTIKALWKKLHTLKEVPEVPATCETAGTKAHYMCTDEGCGKLFLDETYKKEITDESTLVIPAKGHDWGEWEETLAPTEIADGEEIRTCKNDPTHKDPRPIPMLSHTHNMQQTEAKVATCEEDGNISCWYCKDCKNYYSDEAGSSKIDVEDTIIPATGHSSIIEVEAVEATCETAGNIAHYKCEKCNKLFSDDKGKTEISNDAVYIPAKGHDWNTWKVVKEPTETMAGLKVRVCKNDSLHIENEDIPALGGHSHPLIKIDAKEASCDTDGNIEYWYCETCDKYYSDDKASEELTKTDTIVKTTGHDYGEWTVVTEATATTDGLKIRVCKKNSTHIEKEVIPKTSPVDDKKDNGSSTTGDKKDNGTTAPTTEEKKDNSPATPVNVGQEVTDVVTGAVFMAVGKEGNEPSVAFKATDTKSTTIVIPVTVKAANGVEYKVVSVADNAFKDNKNIKKITIPASVKSIGKNAFKGCKNLKTVIIKTTKLTKKSVGANAFKGIHKKAKVKVPKKKLKDYKKILKKAGINGKKQKITK